MPSSARKKKVERCAPPSQACPSSGAAAGAEVGAERVERQLAFAPGERRGRSLVLQPVVGARARLVVPGRQPARDCTLFPYTTLFRSYDLVLTDLRMGDLDGLAIVRLVKEQGET